MALNNRLLAELKGDRVIWAIVGVLSLFSILAVYSSSSTMAFRNAGGNTEFYLLKQVILLGTGLLVTYVCYLMHYLKYKVAAPYMLLVTIPLLLFTLLFGKEVNDATRWIEVPLIGITFQTSDLAKIAIITYVAKAITDKQDYIADFQSAFLPIIIPIVLVTMLIAPADLSTALVIFTSCLMMMFIGRVAPKYIFLLIFCGIVAFAALIVIGKVFPEFIRVETWISRINDFATGKEDPEQVKMAKMAIAKGGIFGNGPGNSLQKNYLPMAWTDYIYAVIIEEYGLFGGFIILGLYVLMFFRVVRLVTISPKTFGAMLAIGLAIILTVQALANMAVGVDLVPVSGLPMPIVSMGGTSMVFSCAAFGIILSVSKYIEEAKD